MAPADVTGLTRLTGLTGPTGLLPDLAAAFAVLATLPEPIPT